MFSRMRHVGDVAAWRICLGCGACRCVCPHDAVTLVDAVNEGIRPLVDPRRCQSCGSCLNVCPGIETAHEPVSHSLALNPRLRHAWGPVLELWEGHASDTSLRYAGASGGAASALAAYCLAHGNMGGVLHTGPSTQRPWKNATVISRTRRQILSCAASRYSPASPCDGLSMLAREAPVGFVGKPCDIAAVRRASTHTPSQAKRFGCLISIFCAGTPCTVGTIDLLDRLGVFTHHIAELRFRGRGWPGMMAVRLKTTQELEDKLTYADSWQFLQRYRPYRCHLCPDGTGELADISCGDPWYRRIEPGEAGRSLIVVRTERGQQIVKGAIARGYLTAARASPDLLPASQQGLLVKRRAVWGRATAFRLLGLPYPRLRGFNLFSNWVSSPLPEKIRSIFGTMRRIRTRRYHEASTYLDGPLEPHTNEVHQ